MDVEGREGEREISTQLNRASRRDFYRRRGRPLSLSLLSLPPPPRHTTMASLRWCVVLPSLLFAVLVVLLPIVSTQSFQILLPPATPTTTDVIPGPAPLPANLTASPLPNPPDPALGSQTYTIADTPPQGVHMSMGVPSNMLGISIELSVANDYLGNKVGEPAYILLNYLEAIRVRAGQGAILRIGGNTQDTAIYDADYNGVILKTGGGFSNGVPVTPTIEYSTVVFNLIAQVASQVDAKVIWGVNMVNDSAGFTVPMVAAVRKAIHDNVLFYLVSASQPAKRSCIVLIPFPLRRSATSQTGMSSLADDRPTIHKKSIWRNGAISRTASLPPTTATALVSLVGPACAATGRLSRCFKTE